MDIAEPFGRINCKESKIDKNVTLAEGRNAGRFLKANKSITSMKQCVSQCCGIRDCDLAFMLNKDCYSVICDSLESCAPKKNKKGSKDTLIAYVARKYHPKCKKFDDTLTGLIAYWFPTKPIYPQKSRDACSSAENRTANLRPFIRHRSLQP